MATKLKPQSQPRILDTEGVFKLTGLTPEQNLAYQILIGDGIDNIPQLMSAGKAKAGLQKFGSIKKWALADKEFAGFVKANLEALRLNKKLVTLVADIEVLVPNIKWNQDPKLPSQYLAYKAFCNPKSKGLFS